MATVAIPVVPRRDAMRLRLLAAHARTLDSEQAKLAVERHALENRISHELGFAVPLRGQRLIDEITRVEQVRS